MMMYRNRKGKRKKQRLKGFLGWSAHRRIFPVEFIEKNYFSNQQWYWYGSKIDSINKIKNVTIDFFYHLKLNLYFEVENIVDTGFMKRKIKNATQEIFR